MENNSITPTETAVNGNQKRIVERSAAYPAIDIEEALRFVDSIAKNFPGSPFLTREDIAAVLKTSASTIQRDIAASAHYNLLNRQKEGYQVSSKLKTINNPLTENEKRKALLEVFGSPKLYQELLSKHDGHAIPPELKTHLIRFHKIAEKAAQEVADTFVKNAKYTGAANEHGILNYKQALAKCSDEGVQYVEVITEEKNNGNGEESKSININQPKHEIENSREQIFLPAIPEAENLKIPLPGKRFAYINYPGSLTKKDIEILRKQIDLLELLAE